jgi:hypothetical protein
MLRLAALLLLIANLLFFAWTQGWLDDATGLRAQGDREPERLARQVRPETVVILPPSAALPGPAPAASIPGPGSALPDAGLVATACLEAGPFATGASVSAIAALQGAVPPLPAGSWADVKVERPGSWIAYLGRYPNREALAKKEEELRRTRVSFEEVSSPPELEFGFSLGRFDQRAAADKALEQLALRGVRSARIVELAAPATLHLLRVEQADPALAARLAALRSDALGRGFVSCGNS